MELDAWEQGARRREGWGPNRIWLYTVYFEYQDAYTYVPDGANNLWSYGVKELRALVVLGKRIRVWAAA